MLKLKKKLAALIGMAMAANTLLVMPTTAFADADSIHTFVFNDYTVDYEVTGGWGNTDVVSLTLSNTGTETIENWMLYFDPHGEIQYVEDAYLMTASDGTEYIKNPGYNVNIAPSSSVKFSYTVNDCEEIPSDYKLCQSRITKETGYAVSLKVNQTWGDNNEYFNGEIIIQNETDAPIEAWELMIDTNFTITEITNSWAASVKELESYSYLLKGTYTGTVPAGADVSLGFIGVKNGDPIISDYSLTEIVVDKQVFYIKAGVDDDIDWSKLQDSDQDGLPDEYEAEYNCDPTNPDTDGDGLPDGYEIMFVGSDPADIHSLDDTLSDGEYDSDSDGLSNYDEYLLGTDPLLFDSDFDGLSDGEEINQYGTDPLNPDTDGDGLSDGDEVALGLDPLSVDSDGDLILDSQEKFDQYITFEGADSDEVVNQIYVSFYGTGNIESTTFAESIMDVDWMCTNLVGLIGEPYDITTSSHLDSAELTFYIDPTNLGETDIENLLILWYDEDTQCFEQMPTTVNSVDFSLSTTVEHFSKYMIVDSEKWFSAWNENYYPLSDVSLHTALTIDCSDSMNSNDAIDEYGECYRKKAATGFIEVMDDNDATSMIFFNGKVSLIQPLTSDKENLLTALEGIGSYGYTNYAAALQTAYNSLDIDNNESADNIIMFISDGVPTDETGVATTFNVMENETIQDAIKNNIKIYTIGLTSNADQTILSEIADVTDGEYFYAASSEELVRYFLSVNMEEKYDTVTDEDEDGIPDLFEIYGMPIANGQVLFSDTISKDKDNDGIAESDPKDTDGDGLQDGEEVIVRVIDNKDAVDEAVDYFKFMSGKIDNNMINDYGGIYFKMISNPDNPDSDGDGIIDIDEVKIVGEDGIAARYGVQNAEYYRYKVDEHFYDYKKKKPKINPLFKDTIQSIYSELWNDNAYNNSNNATYISVDENKITINANVLFLGCSGMLAKNYYGVPDSTDMRTLAKTAIDGIEDRWNSRYEETKEYLGTIYDFYPGMKVTLSTTVKEISTPSVKHISIKFKEESGRSTTNAFNWTTESIPEIKVRKHGDLNDLGAVIAHEFGHAIGLKDAYSNSNNKDYEIVSNDEVFHTKNNYAKPASGEIMYYNGRVLANDIEMVLYAFSENTYQVFIPYYSEATLDISKAIKSRVFYKKYGVSYEWDGISMVEVAK